MSDAFQNDPLAEPRQAFSPLQAMVEQFRQATGPRPAPAPAPTLEQQAQQRAQGRQPPSQPQAEPPSILHQWANNYLPPGSPYPRSLGFPPFQPTMTPRHHSQWGEEEPFPQLPQTFEIPSLAQGLGGFFSQNGSVPIAKIAAALNPTAGAFLQGMAKGQVDFAKQAKEQLALHIAELNEQQTEQLYRYKEVLAEHGVLNQTGDPNKWTKRVGGKTLLEDFWDTAMETGDYGKPGTVGELIAAGAMPSDIIKFLQDRDNRNRDLSKVKTATEEDSREDARLGLPPSGQADEGPSEAEKYAGGARFAPTPALPTEAGLPRGAPAPAAAPKADDVLVPNSSGEMVPASSPGTGADTGVPLDQIKHEIISGAKPPPSEWLKGHKKVYDEATDRALEANQTLDNIIKFPPKDRSKILPMVNAIDPALAKDVDLVRHYKDPASGGVSGTGASLGAPASQYSNRIRQLVSLIDPDWNQGNYQQRQIFQKDMRVQTLLARTQDLAPMAMQLADDLRVLENDLKAKGLNANNVNLNGLLEQFGDDPKYVRMRSDLLAYNQAYNTLVTAGHNTITGVQLQEKGLDPWAPIATYRGVMQGHAVGASGMIRYAENRWKAAGGGSDPMPGGDDEAFKTVRKISKWDYVSGAMPYDPDNKDNDIVVKKAGPWGAAGQYYWTGAFPVNRDDPRNWKPVK